MEQRYMAIQYRHGYAPTEMLGGSGAVAGIKEHADAMDADDVLVVCGPTTSTVDPVMDPIKEQLGDRLGTIYNEVESHVPTDNVNRAIRIAEEADTDLLVSVGGGSAHDTAKAISILGAEEGSAHDYKVTRSGDVLSVPQLEEPKTPLLAVPTTLSAAELNGAAAVTDPDTGEKMIVTDSQAIPKAAIYDPDLGVHTPSEIIATTGMNAIDHTVEMAYSRHRSPFTDATALRGLTLLNEWLPKTIDDPDDTEARGQVMMASALSGFGMEKGVCLNHAICHVLGGKFGIAHGVANSIIIPHGMRYNLDETVAQQAEIAKAIGVPESDDPEATAREGIRRIEELRDEIDAPTDLRETVVSKDDLETIAAEAVLDLPIANNPKPVSKDDIVQILKEAW
jgi:alcohol dehydrogenase class IV